MGVETAVIGGAALGALGSAGSKQKSTTSTATSEPWGVQKPYLSHLFHQAQKLYHSGKFRHQYSPFTQDARGMTESLARDPNSLTALSQRGMAETISGKYLDPKSNPYLSGAVSDALGQAGSSFTSLYGGPAGQNMNNSGFREMLARDLGQTALPIYANAYGQERQNQLNAMSMAPGMEYAQAERLGALGAQDEAQKYANYMSPWSNLQNFQGAISGNYGGTSTTQNPYFTNPLAGAAGGALNAGVLYSLLK